MWHCLSHLHQGPAAVDLNCVVSTQLATIRDKMATSVDSSWCWSLMHQALLSLSNKLDKQLSSDLIAYMVWGSSPTPDNLPLNLVNLELFVSDLSAAKMPFRTSVRVEPSRSAWVVTEKESSCFEITSFNSSSVSDIKQTNKKQAKLNKQVLYFWTQWKHKWYTDKYNHWFLKTFLEYLKLLI